MSKHTEEYESFFVSPAGLSLLHWLEEQRTTEHEKSEDNPDEAPNHAATALAYREVLGHIDSVRVGMGRSSNGAGSSKQRS